MKVPRSLRRSCLLPTVAIGAVCMGAGQSRADYIQTNLVSDIPGLALIDDSELANPWGISESARSPFWISDQGKNATTLYDVTDITNVAKVNINAPNGLVAIPTTAGGPQGPTGQVSNSNPSSFPVDFGGNGNSAHFIFANLNGTISAWDTGTTAYVQATTPGAVYTGLTINTAQTRIYAANGAGTGSVDVFGGSFAPVNVAGAFADPNLPLGYVPFNVQDIGGKVYVTYAPAGRANQIAATAGMGIVDVYSEDGTLQKRLISTGGALASPWGLALAPKGFGEFGGDLLVGNFSYADSTIDAFDPNTGAFLGSIPIDAGNNTPGGLWDLAFGNGVSGGDPNTLYFVDGLNGENDGLFAAIVPVAEPSSLAVLGIAGMLPGLRLIGRRRRD
jgi:uncharacterized protein (TIGR03118 family)